MGELARHVADQDRGAVHGDQSRLAPSGANSVSDEVCEGDRDCAAAPGGPQRLRSVLVPHCPRPNLRHGRPGTPRSGKPRCANSSSTCWGLPRCPPTTTSSPSAGIPSPAPPRPPLGASARRLRGPAHRVPKPSEALPAIPRPVASAHCPAIGRQRKHSRLPAVCVSIFGNGIPRLVTVPRPQVAALFDGKNFAHCAQYRCLSLFPGSADLFRQTGRLMPLIPSPQGNPAHSLDEVR